MDGVLDGYYVVRGWDKKTGVPTREKLDQLGLEQVAEDLAKHGKLP
jgi:aldehyde:ferredoxin oxidoreductase